HVSQRAGKYLQLGGGEPTRQLLRIVTPELRLELRSAIYAARQQDAPESRIVEFETDGGRRKIEVRVAPMDMPEHGRGMLLVLFQEHEPGVEALPPRTASAGPYIEPVVREIEDELLRTRDQLRTTVEQYETSLEELKASNEELQAINEELRSASEEIETSKEELQSVNEELTTLNHELKIKVDEVSHTNSDLQNLMSSTDIGVLFLDRQLNVKRFTPRAQDLFNVIPTDIGRPLAHVTHRLDCDDLHETAKLVLDSLRVVGRELTSRDGQRYLVRYLPYRSIEDRIEGVVLTFVDVTDLRDAVEGRRRSEAALVLTEERLGLALRDTPILIAVLDDPLAVVWGFLRNRELTGSADALLVLFPGDQGDQFIRVARDVLASRVGQRVELDLAVEISLITYDFRIEPRPGGLAVVGFDITPSKLAETTLLDADRRKDEFLATLSHELRNPLTPLKVALDVLNVATDPQQIAWCRDVMERQVAQLTQLVDELLDLSRITQGKIQLDRVNVDFALVMEARSRPRARCSSSTATSSTCSYRGKRCGSSATRAG
ncbi:MAG: PAS domain-containing protein, partial [Deltaproteobacteria bacterium]|nr:PAS domain-containing protein [Deltaproteobacteria bacterium]